MIEETVIIDHENTKGTVSVGQFFKDGYIKLSVYREYGNGATAYLTKAQAKEVAEALYAETE